MRCAPLAIALVWAPLIAGAQSATPTPSACPAAVDGRTLNAHLDELAAQLGTLTADLRARVGLMRSVLQARDAAIARGECGDLGTYDNQLTMLANELKSMAVSVPNAPTPAPATLGTPPPVASTDPAVMPPGSLPPSPAPASPPTPVAGVPPAPAPAPSPGSMVGVPPAPAPASGSSPELASKLGDVLQQLLGKLGSGSGSGQSGNFSSGGGSSSGSAAPGSNVSPSPNPGGGFTNPPTASPTSPTPPAGSAGSTGRPPIITIGPRFPGPTTPSVSSPSSRPVVRTPGRTPTGSRSIQAP